MPTSRALQDDSEQQPTKATTVPEVTASLVDLVRANPIDKRPADVSLSAVAENYGAREELVEIDSIAAFLKREKKRLTIREGELLHQITSARRLVQQAAQRVELLETLKKDVRRKWQIEVDQELQTLAEESHMHQLQSRRE